MFYRENGQFKTSYRADQQIFTIRAGQDRHPGADRRAPSWWCPCSPRDYFYRAILIPLVIMSLAALGVNILVGYCGQISLGSGAFMAVGAYGAYNFFVRIPGMPLIPALILGGLCATFFGILFGLPSLRVKGLYLAVATLAAQFFSDWMFLRIKWFTNNSPSGSVSVNNLEVFGMAIQSAQSKYLFCLARAGGAGPAGQEPGARRHWPRVDGHPRHGRGRQRDRHSPHVRQAQPRLPSAPSSSAWPARCGPLCTWAPGSRPPSRWTSPSSCCSW